MLRYVGLVKTSLVDYPGRVAATVFTHGCPLRCPYCHNPELVSGKVPAHFLPVPQVLEFLSRRRRVLDGVCVTGGEPLLHPDLPDLLIRIRILGYSIKLDTCGMFPERLNRVLEDGLADLVALDIKTAFSHYYRVGGEGDTVRRALAVLRESGVEYELRTTVAPGVVEAEDVRAVTDELLPDEQYVLTQFQPTTTLDPAYTQKAPYQNREVEAWRNEVAAAGKHCLIRGI